MSPVDVTLKVVMKDCSSVSGFAAPLGVINDKYEWVRPAVFFASP